MTQRRIEDSDFALEKPDYVTILYKGKEVARFFPISDVLEVRGEAYVEGASKTVNRVLQTHDFEVTVVPYFV